MKKIKRLFVFLLMLFLLLEGVFANGKFALVLSGGGARGLAHIAVLEELEKRGIVPDLIVGTSMGALIGGFYSAGWTAKEIEELVISSDILGAIVDINNNVGSYTSLSSDSLAVDNLLTFQFGQSGFGGANSIFDDTNINKIIKNNLLKVNDVTDFDQLSIPFRAVGFNIINGEKLIFSSGSLFTALRSSMSLPIVFPPVKIDDETYVMDGGLIDNLPVDVAIENGADIILAVDVNDVLNENRVIDSESLDTLSGVIGAFSISLNIINSVEQYEDADWVLVPDVYKYSDIEFNKTKEIIEKGRECISNNQMLFDQLESEVDRKEEDRVLYSELDYPVIENVEYPGNTGFEDQLLAFVGRSFDTDAADELDELLEKIKRYNNFKEISYAYADGTITVKSVDYSKMEGLLALGVVGNLGMKHDGENNPYFAMKPNMSLALEYHITPRSLISAALIYHDTLTIQTRYSMPLINHVSLFTGVNFDYMNLSVYSIAEKAKRITKNDFGVTAEAGVFWNIFSTFSVESAFMYDYTHLASFSSPDDSANVLVDFNKLHYVYFSLAVKYDSLDKYNATASGFKIDFRFDSGIDFSFSPVKTLDFGYNTKLSFEALFGYRGLFKGLAEIELDTIRRNRSLSEAYVSTRTGNITSDYIYALIGVRVAIPNTRFYVDIAPFYEAFEKQKSTPIEYINQERNSIPFTLLTDWTLGMKIGFGASTQLGIVYADFYFGASDKFRCALIFGIK